MVWNFEISASVKRRLSLRTLLPSEVITRQSKVGAMSYEIE